MTTLESPLPLDIDAEHYHAADLRQPGVVVGATDPGTRSALARRLASGGFNVWAARSGPEVLDALTCHGGEVDVLLIDDDLPGLTGDFLRRLKAGWGGVRCILRIGEADSVPAMLSAASSGTVPKSLEVAILFARLWEAAAFGEWKSESEPRRPPPRG